ncbi:MAG: AraC family transcriptional regulator [Rhodobiaceae bacterium]|nr:AraC family transcriptional regulator [Rhodobiaceae bacterium]MCC0016546.1 AraC family transcriptional regulator [Rhodobiaceae bacterium]MCC0042380.1 AraC family transcriptional regulator [Rhodobiaceae bacterium]
MSELAMQARGGASVEPAILAAAATGIVTFIERHGGDIDSIFGNSGISPEMAGETTLKLRLSDFCTLFEQASKRTRFDNFGLWFGNQFQPRDLGLWGYAAVSSPTLGSALENLVGLFGYHQEQSSMRLGRAKNGLMALQYRIEAPDIMQRRQDAELSLGMFLNVMREALGSGWTPEEVHLEHARPVDCDEHERAFGAPVYFAQPYNALLFRSELLQRPMPHGDPKLMALMRICLQQLGERKDRPAELSDRVRAAVRARLPEGYPSLESVADELRMSTGAIQRGLAQQGTSFKDIVERTRREMALTYLGQRHLPISEISFLLGYSELSAFSRAVRRWSGTSPSTLRDTLLAG